MSRNHILCVITGAGRGFGRAFAINYAASILSMRDTRLTAVLVGRSKEALESLKAKPGVEINVTKPDGWTIITERDPYTMWSFAPEGHYAYPAVVRRVLKQDDRGVFIEMSALCQAEKAPCDRLIRDFQQLNERIRESFRNRK